jgi:hypothetical protein
MPRKRQQFYYVLHLGGNIPPEDPDRPFEIQVLDKRYHGKAAGHVGLSESKLVVDGHVIPTEVLDAARRLPSGYGDTVDSSGKSVDPLAWTREFLTDVRANRPPYFVMRLADDEPELSLGYEFEVQILDAKGRARAIGHIGSSEAELIIEGHAVPFAVIEAARRQPKGAGDYVNKHGQSVHPITGEVRIDDGDA